MEIEICPSGLEAASGGRYRVFKVKRRNEGNLAECSERVNKLMAC
jgi:hypothetical protein